MGAKAGHLSQFPHEALTIENLFEAFDEHDQNVAMIAAEAGFIDHIPSALLTRTTLSAANRHGRTVFHCVASCGRIQTLPERLITFGVLGSRTSMAAPR